MEVCQETAEDAESFESADAEDEKFDAEEVVDLLVRPRWQFD